jgi:hypothetical protein
MTDATLALQNLGPQMIASFRMRRLRAFAAPAIVLMYLIYIAISFDVAGLAARARMDNAAILLSDFWSYKTHVTRDNRTDKVVVAIEGESKGTYPDGMLPEWVMQRGGVTTIDLNKGYIVTYDDAGARFVVPGYGTIDIVPKDGTLDLTAPQPLPAWINQTDTRISVTTPQGRFAYSRSKVETFRYQAGWELFFFTLDSAFYGKSLGQLISLATVGDRVDPARSNLAGMAQDFWTNKMWHHREVAWHDGGGGDSTAAGVSGRDEFQPGAGGAVRLAPGVRLCPWGGRVDLDHHPVAGLWSGADDRGLGHPDYGHRIVRQDVFGNAGKHRRQAGRRYPVNRGQRGAAGAVRGNPADHARAAVAGSVLP